MQSHTSHSHTLSRPLDSCSRSRLPKVQIHIKLTNCGEIGKQQIKKEAKNGAKDPTKPMLHTRISDGPKEGKDEPFQQIVSTFNSESFSENSDVVKHLWPIHLSSAIIHTHTNFTQKRFSLRGNTCAYLNKM